jgi:hypothetical protein
MAQVRHENASIFVVHLTDEYYVIPNSSENFTFELRQSPGVERS